MNVLETERRKGRRAGGQTEPVEGGGRAGGGRTPAPHRPAVPAPSPCPYLQGHRLPLEAAVVTALVRVRVALHPVAGGCSGHGCDGHDPPVLVVLTATCRVGFRGLAVGGTHRLGVGTERAGHHQVWPTGQQPLAGSQVSGSGLLALQMRELRPREAGSQVSGSGLLVLQMRELRPRELQGGLPWRSSG